MNGGGPATAGPGYHSLVWENGVLWVLDQRLLPSETQYLRADTVTVVDDAIRALAQHGRSVVPARSAPVTVIHHCNTGSLATMDYGTALDVIRAAHESSQRLWVLVDETRPLRQGARLTMWEIQQLGIPAALMVDGAAARQRRTRALAAQAHGVPFCVAAPASTIDLARATGDAMVIEERAGDEVAVIGGRPMAPDGVAVLNPAFAVTPAAFVAGITTEVGVLRPPYPDALAAAVARAGSRTP